MGVRYLMLLGLLCWAAYTDMVRTKVSNRLILLGLFIGLVFRIFGEGKTGILIYALHISIPVVVLYLLFQLHALGAGDIKLFSVIGAFVTTEQLVEIIVWAFVVGASCGALKLLYKYHILRGVNGKITQIHFSPAILIAYLIGVWRWFYG